jgi:ribosomal protein S12 methylthiotransferase accessory factor
MKNGIRIFDREYCAAKEWKDGTHRVRSPSETLSDFSRWMPLMGITRLADITGLDYIGIPVVMAIRPNARLLATAQGKGIDREAARASALMESIECWHAEMIDGPLRYESYAGLQRKGANVVDVQRLPRMPNSILDLEMPRTWIEGYDLIQKRASWVPFETVTLPALYCNTHQVFGMDGNGLASGNHLLESIAHGLCEVIERDATKLWTHCESSITNQVDLSTVDDPHCREFIDRFVAAGVHIAAFETTSDIGIPSYVALCMEKSDPNQWRSMLAAYGFGCHLAPGVALSRALTEAAQVRLTMIAGSRDDTTRDLYARMFERRHHAQMWEEMTQQPATSSFSTVRDLSTPTFEGDVDLILTSLHRCGIESVVVVDLTREDLGVPVTQVIVPGLEGTESHLPGSRIAAQGPRAS